MLGHSALVRWFNCEGPKLEMARSCRSSGCTYPGLISDGDFGGRCDCRMRTASIHEFSPERGNRRPHSLPCAVCMAIPFPPRLMKTLTKRRPKLAIIWTLEAAMVLATGEIGSSCSRNITQCIMLVECAVHCERSRLVIVTVMLMAS